MLTPEDQNKISTFQPTTVSNLGTFQAFNLESEDDDERERTDDLDDRLCVDIHILQSCHKLILIIINKSSHDFVR